MAGRSGRKVQSRRVSSTSTHLRHPYRGYEGSPTWAVLEKGIRDLVENADIEEKTPRRYIVGYLCKLLDGLQGEHRRE